MRVKNKTGMTLIELTIGAAVSMIVIFAATTGFQWIQAEMRQSEILRAVQNLQTDAVYSVLTKAALGHSISKAAGLPGGINGQLAACILSEIEPKVACPADSFHVVLIPKTRGGTTHYGQHRFSGMGPGFKPPVRTFYNTNGFRCDGAPSVSERCPIEIWSEIQCKYDQCGRDDVAQKLEVVIHYDVYEFRPQASLSQRLSKIQKMTLDVPLAEQESPLMHPNLIMNEEINWIERRE